MFRNLLTLMIMMNGIPSYDAENTNNVGTVLFSTADLGKRHWSADEIGLLAARRYFQSLLPPPLFVSTLNENYVDLLFNYFGEAYSAINRETDHPDTDRTMTAALSDCIGGYLKAWVLPVTKFAFYGGTISEQNVTTLFEFYNEIKRYLRTDGDGWHTPKSHLFDVSIKTAVPKVPTIVKGKYVNPCDHFVFFERTPEGLNVPIPHIGWDGASSKLFLPLKSHSIYAMNSINSSSVLLKYYNMAKYCLQQRYPSMLKNFETRFQSWLAYDVVPHLGDANVYLALGSVLTVMNKSRELYANVQYMCDKGPKQCNTRLNTFTFSKKTLIVTLLIVIEMVWCCVALIYMCYAKRNKNKASHVCRFAEPRHPDHQDKCYNTRVDLDCEPFRIEEDIVACKGGEAVQTGVDTLFLRGKSCSSRCKCSSGAPNIVTQQSIEILTTDSLIFTKPEIYSKKASKRSSSQSVAFSTTRRSSTTNTAVPISGSKTIINTVGTDRCLKHNNSKQIDNKDKEVDKKESKKTKKAHNARDTQKSKKDGLVPTPERELKAIDYRHSSRYKVSKPLKSQLSYDIPRIRMETLSREPSIHTTELLKSENMSYTAQQAQLPINSSKNQNMVLGTNDNVRNEVCQYSEAGDASPGYVDVQNTTLISLLKTESQCKPTSETHAEITPHDSVVNFKIVKTETRILGTPKYFEEKQSVNHTSTSVSAKHSIRAVEHQKNTDCTRNVYSRNQEIMTYSSQPKSCAKDVIHPKSHSYIINLEPKASTPKRSKELVSEDIIPTSVSTTTTNPPKADTENKTRPSIQKEFKGTKHNKEPYWEIVIDEPQKDVYVDIRGTIKIDSRNTKRSRIPKLSPRKVEPASTSDTPRVTRAGSLIPQLKKVAVDDLVLTASAERNKLNTSI